MISVTRGWRGRGPDENEGVVSGAPVAAMEFVHAGLKREGGLAVGWLVARGTCTLLEVPSCLIVLKWPACSRRGGFARIEGGSAHRRNDRAGRGQRFNRPAPGLVRSWPWPLRNCVCVITTAMGSNSSGLPAGTVLCLARSGQVQLGTLYSHRLLLARTGSAGPTQEARRWL